MNTPKILIWQQKKTSIKITKTKKKKKPKKKKKKRKKGKDWKQASKQAIL
jgi:hypothetical protein